MGPGGDPARPGRPGPGRTGRSGLGAYGVQAAIAECHAVAPSVEETDWERIVLLYEALGRLAPSPVVELNRAVAVSMAQGPAAALPVVDDLVGGGQPRPAPTCCRASGASCSAGSAIVEARHEIEQAVRLCRNERERSLLQRSLPPLHLPGRQVAQPLIMGMLGNRSSSIMSDQAPRVDVGVPSGIISSSPRWMSSIVVDG